MRSKGVKTEIEALGRKALIVQTDVAQVDQVRGLDGPDAPLLLDASTSWSTTPAGTGNHAQLSM